eukprot:3982420-Amphidinium_carterae.1
MARDGAEEVSALSDAVRCSRKFRKFAGGKSIKLFLKARAVLAERRDVMAKAWLQKHGKKDFAEQVVGLANMYEPGTDLDGSVALAKQVSRQVNSVTKKEQEDLYLLKKRYDEEVGQVEIDKVKTALPFLGSMAMEHVPLAGVELFKLIPS